MVVNLIVQGARFAYPHIVREGPSVFNWLKNAFGVGSATGITAGGIGLSTVTKPKTTGFTYQHHSTTIPDTTFQARQNVWEQLKREADATAYTAGHHQANRQRIKNQYKNQTQPTPPPPEQKPNPWKKAAVYAAETAGTAAVFYGVSKLTEEPKPEPPYQEQDNGNNQNNNQNNNNQGGNPWFYDNTWNGNPEFQKDRWDPYMFRGRPPPDSALGRNNTGDAFTFNDFKKNLKQNKGTFLFAALFLGGALLYYKKR